MSIIRYVTTPLRDVRQGLPSSSGCWVSQESPIPWLSQELLPGPGSESHLLQPVRYAVLSGQVLSVVLLVGLVFVASFTSGPATTLQAAASGVGRPAPPPPDDPYRQNRAHAVVAVRQEGEARPAGRERWSRHLDPFLCCSLVLLRFTTPVDLGQLRHTHTQA